MPPPSPRLSHDTRILLMALGSALPGAVISLIFLWTGDSTPKVQWTLTVVILSFCLGFAFALRERVVLPLQTLSNLLAALGEGDFSIRVSAPGYVPLSIPVSALGEGEHRSGLRGELVPLCDLHITPTHDGRRYDLEPVVLLYDERQVAYKAATDALVRIVLEGEPGATGLAEARPAFEIV